MKKLKISDEKLVEYITRVSKLFARDFTFGIYDEDDILQECILIGFKVIKKFKHNKSSGVTLEEKLERFLYVSILNRLKNFRRDKFCRNDAPCAKCYKGKFCCNNSPCPAFQRWKKVNDTKMSVQSPFSLNETNTYSLQMEDILICGDSQRYLDGVDSNDMIKLLESKLNVKLLEDFQSMRSGEKISNSRKQRLLDAIRIIVRGEEDE